MEEKRKRGRPRKNTTLPLAILKMVDVVLEQSQLEFLNIVKEIKHLTKGYWDIKLEDNIEFFDKNLSYELTGYRPINNRDGLDFDPKWFIEARETFKETGHYCQFPRNTKAYADFWTKEYIKCRDGMTVNGYTITGDHYFFLNYYQLANLDTAKAGEGRLLDFPSFYVAQYEWFHYLELAKRLRKNVVLMKARGVGQIERPTLNSGKSVKTKVINHYVNTEVSQIIADHCNALEMNANESNNFPKSPEHSILNENVR